MPDAASDIALELARKVREIFGRRELGIYEKEMAVAALLRPHVCREEQIDDSFVEAVEDQIGMGAGAWDVIDPETICRAVLKVAARAALSSVPLSLERPEIGSIE